MLKKYLHDGKAPALKALLDQGGEIECTYRCGEINGIAKRLKAIYRVIFCASEVIVREERILNRADVPIATSKIADSDMFSPTVTSFDEAGMMTESEGMLAML